MNHDYCNKHRGNIFPHICPMCLVKELAEYRKEEKRLRTLKSMDYDFINGSLIAIHGLLLNGNVKEAMELITWIEGLIEKDKESTPHEREY